MTSRSLPIVGVSACLHKGDTPKPYHSVDDKYLRAVSLSAQSMPVIIPALGNLLDIPNLISNLDGIMLTGSNSNVFPELYQTRPTPDAEPYDQMRDQTTFAIIHEALKQEVPLLAICRGFQELNVAMGGSLYSQIKNVSGRMDHSSPDTNEMDIDYGPSHNIQLNPEGELFKILKTDQVSVNSLHYQAVKKVGEGLTIDAQADDGTVEAISMPLQPSFVLGVQWHPEYKSQDNPVSRGIFSAFGAAVTNRALSRTQV
ncbi:gamma-glutamyl-gamma-aminobutyrate hydrolase family protein [Kiloniella sp.]|uniref:gamma-glutamyl-gamma-aminobutyrate hydrolase family protein n=1 Tax=Kiloniella sp. TaxID=1938587 RepID=UPI003B016562